MKITKLNMLPNMIFRRCPVCKELMMTDISKNGQFTIIKHYDWKLKISCPGSGTKTI